MLKSAATVVGCGVAVHGTIVCGALLRSLRFAEEHDLEQPNHSSSIMVKEGQTSASSAVLGAILTMYSQCCVNEASFARHVTFDDPAARTEGFDELKEAFRALRKLQPQTLNWELGSVHQGRVEVHLWQRYTIGPKEIDLFSKVVAEHDAEGRIVQLEDRWKGLPLLDSPPFTWARRLNGVMSFWLTPLLKADEFE